MTRYTLWRGDVLLGRFVEQQLVTHHGKRVGAAGLLEPTDAFAGIPPVMQTRIRMLPGTPIFQSPMNVPDVNEANRPRRHENHQIAELQPMTADEARGVPADRVLIVRDEAGEPIDTDMVSLWLLPDEVDLAQITHIHGASVAPRNLWYVSFATHAGIAT